MNFRIDAYPGCNITLVFESMDLAKISRDRIRAAMPEAALMDTPELLVIMAPPGLAIQVGQGRVIVGDQTQSPPGSTDIWTPTTVLAEAAQGFDIVAFGFNYDADVSLEGTEDAGAYLTQVLLPTADTLRAGLGAQRLSLAPRLRYTKGSAEYDVRLEPLGGAAVRVHLNCHFARQPLPDAEALRESLTDGFREVGTVLGTL